MKVDLHIGRLVVHGAAEFDREAFEDALRREIAARLPATGADAEATALRLRQADASSFATAPPLRGDPGVADAADGLATRLLGKAPGSESFGVKKWP